ARGSPGRFRVVLRRTEQGGPTCSQLGRPHDGAFCDSVGLAPRRTGMKAIVFAQTGGPEVLVQADVPKPDVRPGGVLIKNHAIGVNFADTPFRQGTYTVKPKLPDSPGTEVAGAIEAGGVGSAAVQLATAAGARVFGTVSSDAKAGLAKEAGADAIINYVKDKFADEVLRLTSDRGVDLILDAVGKPTFEEGLRCLAAF